MEKKRSDNTRILLVWPYKSELSTPIAQALSCGFMVLLLESEKWLDRSIGECECMRNFKVVTKRMCMEERVIVM